MVSFTFKFWALILATSFFNPVGVFAQVLDQYIIFMDATTMPRMYSSPYHWHLATLSSSASQTTTPPASKLIYTYSHVIDGFCATLTPSELASIKTSPGFLHSIGDSPLTYDTTHSTEFLGLSGSHSGAWELANYGDGLIIGVVDTGVWPESKSYSDLGMSPVPAKWKGKCENGSQFNASLCNNKLIGARVFNKGLIARNITLPFYDSPRDVEGHGTHTSSTAAGNFVHHASYFGYAPGTAKGVAPRAHVAMYKALFGEHSFKCDVVAAIDRAVADGVDILSMSFGFDNVPLHEDPIALVTLAAVEKNVFVATAAGNMGTQHNALHNGIPWVLTVAAGTMDRQFKAWLRLRNGGGVVLSVFGSSLYSGNYSSREAPVIFMDDCADVTREVINGKILVCQGINYDQLFNLDNSSAIGGVFIVNDTSSLIEYLSQTFSPVPAIFMTPKEGQKLEKYLKAGHPETARGSLEFGITSFDLRPAPTVARFSSRGPSASCPWVMKPDIMGPGSVILAAWPSTLNTYFKLLSGTSMSCPHLAGVAALIKKVHRGWSPGAIRSAMMTTADTMDLSGQPIQDSSSKKSPATATGFAMGAGQVNPRKAMDPGLVYDLNSTDYASLLCAMNLTTSQIKAITTRSSSTNNNNNNHYCSARSLDLNYPSFMAFFNPTRSNEVLEFQRTLTNVGKEIMSTYKAAVTPMNGVKVKVVPKELVFKGKGDKLSFIVVIESIQKKPFQNSGYLKWVEEGGGKHVVQSPIVATNAHPQLLSP